METWQPATCVGALDSRRVASKFVLAFTFGCFIESVFPDVVNVNNLEMWCIHHVCAALVRFFFVVEPYHVHFSFGRERAPSHRPSGENNLQDECRAARGAISGVKWDTDWCSTLTS